MFARIPPRFSGISAFVTSVNPLSVVNLNPNDPFHEIIGDVGNRRRIDRSLERHVVLNGRGKVQLRVTNL
jgi:hypothetical protein